MGGRGASSGISNKGRRYGSEYKTVMSVGNIKFVTKMGRNADTLMETMTRGRVYVHVEGNDLKSIIYFDNKNKRKKQIDLDHYHKGKKPHTHNGYFHNENDSSKGYSNLTTEEKKMVDRVVKIWKN